MQSIIDEYKSLIDNLLDSKKISFDDNLSARLLKEPGVYIIWEIDSDKEIAIYVGKTKNIKRRIKDDHYRGDRVASTLKRKLINNTEYKDEKDVMRYLSNKCYIQFLILEDANLRSRFEHFVISVLSPLWND